MWIHSNCEKRFFSFIGSFPQELDVFKIDQYYENLSRKKMLYCSYNWNVLFTIFYFDS